MTQAQEIKRKFNWLYIFQQGYQLIALPLNLFSFATTTYYLMVSNVNFLKALFPDFFMFLLFSAVVGVPTVWILGAVYIRSELFKGQTKVQPYSYLITPNMIPLYLAQADIAERMGLVEDAESLRRVVRRSS